MSQEFPDRVAEFLRIANQNNVRMILVGGGAVNFYGYQRRSADIVFWVETSLENLRNLLRTLQQMNYSIQELPKSVIEGEQNISVKLSPVFELELLTRFNPGKSFSDAYASSQLVDKEGVIYHVISFEDLISSKISSERMKDKMDIEELQRIRLKRNE